MSSFRRSSAGASDPYGLSRPKRISVANEYTSYIRNKEKNSKSAKAPKETLASLDGANPSGGPKKFIVKPPIRNIAEEVEEEPFSISGLMRYFIIAAIIILILVLVGGQALQMSKNMEK